MFQVNFIALERALQTAKTELTKEREEAEGRTTAAREALGTGIRAELKTEHDAWVHQLMLHADARHQVEKSLSAAIAKETSERGKGLVKATDEYGKLRAELEGEKSSNKRVRDELDKELRTTELTKNVDAKVDALEEKIQGLKKGADDLEEDIGKTLTQVKDGAERALSAAKGALLEELEKHKAESLKALQTAKTELTKEREEAEGRTTAASEAQEGSRAGEEDNTEVPAAWVESLSLEEQQECVHQGKITWTLAVRKYPDKIADFLLSREIGETITKQQLKTCCDALKGIGVTVGLNSTDAGVLWKKLRPGD